MRHPKYDPDLKVDIMSYGFVKHIQLHVGYHQGIENSLQKFN